MRAKLPRLLGIDAALVVVFFLVAFATREPPGRRLLVDRIDRLVRLPDHPSDPDRAGDRLGGHSRLEPARSGGVRAGSHEGGERRPRAPVATRRSIRAPEQCQAPDADHRSQARFTRERALPCRPRGDQRLNQAIFGRGLIRMPMRIVSVVLAAATAAVVFSGDVLGARQPAATTEVVVTLKSPSLASFGRTLQSAGHSAYRAAHAGGPGRPRRARPVGACPAPRSAGATRSWRTASRSSSRAPQLGALAAVPGVDRVWPNVRYHSLRTVGGPEQIGADKLWGPNFATAGNGMKIGIIDDGLDATHPYFNPAGYAYPPGVPEGPDAVHDAEGDRAADVRAAVADVRVRATRRSTRRSRSTPLTSPGSPPATTARTPAATTISGVAPNAYLGNYKALTIPTPDFGLDGNSAEIAAAIEAAVSDGMDVINLSLGEPEIEPSRDIVVAAIDGAAAAGVVPVIAAGNDFDEFGYGSVSLAGQRVRRDHRRRGQLERRRGRLLVGRPDAGLARDEARRRGARRRRSSRRSAARAAVRARSAARAWRRRTSPARPRCCASGTRPGRWRRSSRRSTRPATRSARRPAARCSRPARAAASSNLVARRQPAALRRADRPLVRTARRAAPPPRSRSRSPTPAAAPATGPVTVVPAIRQRLGRGPADRHRARARSRVTATRRRACRATSPASSC